MSDHPEIWLEPKCAEDNHPEGRQWCQDDVFSNCPECGEKKTRYIRADIVEAERQRTDDLIEEVKRAAELTVGHKAMLAITTGDGDPYVKATFSDLEGSRSFVDGLIALRALLSKLEVRK
ncbi:MULTISPECIES: hypothetical protein [unclassified Rhizobium]|uniref:hypothetical protein n=1 Tax=unclassified Rhizobium TaxID=2613769 RepID=UPI0018EB8026